MYTANTMACVAEALGMSLPGLGGPALVPTAAATTSRTAPARPS